MNGGLIRIRMALEQLKASERKVAEYILVHPREIVSQSVAELALKCGSSQAAVMRLCKTLGFKGYPELKLRVAGDLQEQSAEGYRVLSPGDPIHVTIRGVTGNNVQTLRDSEKLLDPELVSRAVRTLYEAERIYVYGVGASHLVALAAQQLFFRINKVCVTFADSRLQLTSSVTISERDAAVGISLSGEAREVVACLINAKKQGAATIAITRFGANPLSRCADITLPVSVPEGVGATESMTGRLAQLNLIDILYQGVARLDYDHSVNYVTRARQVLREMASN